MGLWKLLLGVKSSQRRLQPLGRGVGSAALAEGGVVAAVESWAKGTQAPVGRLEKSLSTLCPCP